MPSAPAGDAEVRAQLAERGRLRFYAADYHLCSVPAGAEGDEDRSRFITRLAAQVHRDDEYRATLAELMRLDRQFQFLRARRRREHVGPTEEEADEYERRRAAAAKRFRVAGALPPLPPPA